MMRKIKAGTTSLLLRVFIRDTSITSRVAGLTGLAYNSASLTLYYARAGDSSMTAISLVTMTVGTWASGGFKEVDSTHAPGLYELGIPNAALAAGAPSVVFFLRGATNMEDIPFSFELDAVDYQDTVRFGLTALPNANAEAAGGLFTRGTGAGQINQDANGRADVNAKAWAGGAIPAAAVTGVPLVDLKYILGTILTETAGQIAAAFKKLFDVATPVLTAQSVNQTGDSYARLGAPAGASIAADIAAGSSGEIFGQSGAISQDFIIEDTLGNRVPYATVYVAKDTLAAERSPDDTTDELGQVTFRFRDAGAYYLWAYADNVNFGSLPRTITVPAP